MMNSGLRCPVCLNITFALTQTYLFIILKKKTWQQHKQCF